MLDTETAQEMKVIGGFGGIHLVKVLQTTPNK